MNSVLINKEFSPLLSLYSDLIGSVSYSHEDKNGFVRLSILSYDLIDKDLDYDEQHHACLAESLIISLERTALDLIETLPNSKMTLFVNNVIMRDIEKKRAEIRIFRHDKEIETQRTFFEFKCV